MKVFKERFEDLWVIISICTNHRVKTTKRHKSPEEAVLRVWTFLSLDVVGQHFVKTGSFEEICSHWGLHFAKSGRFSVFTQFFFPAQPPLFSSQKKLNIQRQSHTWHVYIDSCPLGAKEVRLNVWLLFVCCQRWFLFSWPPSFPDLNQVVLLFCQSVSQTRNQFLLQQCVVTVLLKSDQKMPTLVVL